MNDLSKLARLRHVLEEAIVNEKNTMVPITERGRFETRHRGGRHLSSSITSLPSLASILPAGDGETLSRR
jgi:hypothetical protein